MTAQKNKKFRMGRHKTQNIYIYVRIQSAVFYLSFYVDHLKESFKPD